MTSGERHRPIITLLLLIFSPIQRALTDYEQVLILVQNRLKATAISLY